MSGSGDVAVASRIDTGTLSIVTAGYSRNRMEVIVGVSAAIGSAVLGVQALLLAIGAPGVPEPLAPVLIASHFSLLLLCALGYLFPRWRRAAGAVYLGAYTLLLVLWPVFAAGSPASPTPEPWYWFLLNIASTASLVALRGAWPAIVTGALPLIYGVVRFSQLGPSKDALVALAFEVSYPLILGFVIVVLVNTFRGLGDRVDDERAGTVSAYRRAAEAEVEQEERIALSALMHDGVLAALIAAERAESPREQSLAVSMAREALASLAEGAPVAEEEPARAQSRNALARSIRAGLAELGLQAEITVEPLRGEPPIPAAPASALARAATQAAVNALQHARGEGLAVTISAAEGSSDQAASVRIVVADSGPGFDVANIPADRLGISASIRARVAAVGGSTDIVSSNAGTIVTIEWTEC